jgi:Kef-type K+ transport system membrane component KefB
LNDGITWAYVIAIIVIAFSGKIIGGTLAAKFNGLVWRESLTIGVLMSCKGLVELIVLVCPNKPAGLGNTLTGFIECRSSSSYPK